MDRVLIARFHSLGDVVLATGIVHACALRGEQVSVLTSPRFVSVFEGLPLAGILTPQNLPADPAGRFDRVIDLQANASSRRVLHRLGPIRSQRGRGFARRWLVFWGNRAPRPRLPHVVERYGEAAGCAGAGAGVRALRPRVAVTEEDRDEARRFPLAFRRTEGCCVGLAVGGSRRMKRWPAERFDALERDLAARGIAALRFVEPRGDATEVQGTVRAPLRALKALLSRCAAVVTNDSGVMHLAVGLDVPVVAVFGSTVPEFGFSPLGPRDRVLQRPLACRPCAVHGARFCWQGHERCLQEIGASDVLREIVDLLE